MSLQFKNVSFTYQAPFDRSVQALSHINLEIDQHIFLALIGRTGSGKSTLVQHMNGLYLPEEGQVLVDGMDTRESSEVRKKIRQKVGLVFQYPEDQLFEETVFDDIAFGPRHTGLNEEETQQRVEQAMQQTGMDFDTFKDRSPFELSGGEQRRVAIAGVLALAPKYLILDEPAAGLDPQGRKEIMNRIFHFYEEHPEMSVIMVSHSMEEVARLANRLLVMDQGRLVMDGSPREIFAHEQELEELGLGLPPITRISKKLAQRHYPVPEEALTVDELLNSLTPLIAEGKIVLD